MQMRRFIFSLRNLMDVDIEQRLRRQREAGKTGFFQRFAQRGRGNRLVTVIDMATRLHPAIELGVMQQQCVGGGYVDDPGRGGDVPLESGTAPPLPRLALDEGNYFLPVDFFFEVERDMRVELCEQGFGVHGGQ